MKRKMLDERDVRAAYFKRSLLVDEFMRDVAQAKAERELEECSAEMKRLVDENAADAGLDRGAMFANLSRWTKRQDELDRVFKRHDVLLNKAYPPPTAKQGGNFKVTR